MMPDEETDEAKRAEAKLKREAFIKHLEHASEVVRSWPAWKQRLLGGEAHEAERKA